MEPHLKIPMAGVLSWVLPGLGHFLIGEGRRGLILMVTITVAFWSGVAIGGVRGTVNPEKRLGWFLAELGTGGNTLAAYALSHAESRIRAAKDAAMEKQRGALYLGHWRSVDVGVVYASVAGLLNLLVILDAVGRAGRKSRPESAASARTKGG